MRQPLTDVGGVPTHVALPEGSGPWPGVVVVHDALGMTSDLVRHADWLAGAGYLAAAPDLFHGGGRLRCVVRAMRTLAAGEGEAFDDLDGVRRWLADHPDGTGRVGVVGFCLGGGYAIALAPTGDYAAASVNYGVAGDDLWDGLGDACPIVASFGGRDRSLPGAADRLERVLAEHGVPHDVEEYPDAGHGFLNDHTGELPLWAAIAGRYARTGYHETSAVDARERILTFFAEHLGPGA